MLRIYVAGPYSANNVIDVLKNIGRGQKACADLFSMGFAPFCPWHDMTFVTDRFDDVFDIQSFYDYSIAWLVVSDAVLLVGEWEKSKGTVKEVNIASKQSIPVFKDILSLKEWAK